MLACVQARWRGHRARKLLRQCHTILPFDVWRLIVHHLSDRPSLLGRRVINRILTLRCIRICYSPPPDDVSHIFKIIELADVHSTLLSRATREWISRMLVRTFELDADAYMSIPIHAPMSWES